MTLSNASRDRIADALSEDFNVFIHEFYEAQLSEVLADAAVLFVDSEFGAMDGDLAADIALRLLDRQNIVSR